MQWTRHIDYTHPNGQGVSLLDVVLIYNECYGLTNWASSVVLYAFILQRKCPKRWRLTRGLNISLLELTFKEKKIKDLFVNGISDWATILEFFENFLFQFTTFFGTANSILLFGKSRLRPHPPCVQICSRSIFVKKILIFLEMQITQKFPSSLSRQASKNAKRISVKKIK